MAHAGRALTTPFIKYTWRADSKKGGRNMMRFDPVKSTGKYWGKKMQPAPVIKLEPSHRN
jgi:hypothetical protein